MSHTQDCFILDTGSALYVWVGKGATNTEKTQSVIRAQSNSTFTFFQQKKTRLYLASIAAHHRSSRLMFNVFFQTLFKLRNIPVGLQCIEL